MASPPRTPPPAQNDPSALPGLLRHLLREGLLTPEAAQKATEGARKAGSQITGYLVENRMVKAHDIASAVQRNLGLPILDLSAFDLTQAPIASVNEKLIRKYRVLPLWKRGPRLFVALADPTDQQALDEIKFQTGLAVEPVIVLEDRIGTAIEQALDKPVMDMGGQIDEGLDNITVEGGELEVVEDTVGGDADDTPIVRFVNRALLDAINRSASDIHFEPYETSYRVRYRIDGMLYEVAKPPSNLSGRLAARLKVMAHLDIAERRLPQDGRINLELDGEPIDVRVATIPSVNGESVALRLLTRKKFDMNAIGLDDKTEATLRKLIAAPNGIILVTGPTGSGKSTTLYTLLKELNTKDRRIVTIEDPVENKLDGVVQIAVKPEIDLTFAAGLRSILRGDPNVIMVGEMRDQETVEIAIRGALTGHLVLSTLHTNDAVGGISRLLDMGIEPFMVASSVRAFQAQRLVRTLCGACKQPAHYEESYLTNIGIPADFKRTFFKPGGCRSCRGTGFTGRLAIMEICVMTEALQDKINQRANAIELKAQALKDGMVPMRQYGFRKASEGITTLEEVLTVTAASE